MEVIRAPSFEIEDQRAAYQTEAEARCDGREQRHSSRHRIPSTRQLLTGLSTIDRELSERGCMMGFSCPADVLLAELSLKSGKISSLTRDRKKSHQCALGTAGLSWKMNHESDE